MANLNWRKLGQVQQRTPLGPLYGHDELYGSNKVHPSEAPRREEATVVVIHMSDVESIDSSCVAAPPDSSRHGHRPMAGDAARNRPWRPPAQ